MPRTKTRLRRRSTSRSNGEITLTEALARVDQDMAGHLSFFYAELARAQREGDDEGVEYTRSAIAEAMRGVPDGDIDVPLFPRCGSAKKSKNDRAISGISPCQLVLDFLVASRLIPL